MIFFIIRWFIRLSLLYVFFSVYLRMHAAQSEPMDLLYPFSNIKYMRIDSVRFPVLEQSNSQKQIYRNGILVRYPDAKATILICHGFMCNAVDTQIIRSLFPMGKFNFLSFDFRAHGLDRKNQYCTFGKDEALDVLGATQFIRQMPDLKTKPILAYGFSMGAVAAIEAQAKNPQFEGMILDCPFDTSANIIKKGLDNVKISLFGYQVPLLGRTMLEKYAFHPYVQSFVKFMLKIFAHMDTNDISTNIKPVFPAESVKKINAPCLFIHCKKDEKVSVNSILKVFDGARGYKKLWLTNGERHFGSLFYNPEEYVYRLNKFYSDVLGKKLQGKKQPKIVVDHDIATFQGEVHEV